LLRGKDGGLRSAYFGELYQRLNSISLELGVTHQDLAKVSVEIFDSYLGEALEEFEKTGSISLKDDQGNVIAVYKDKDEWVRHLKRMVDF